VALFVTGRGIEGEALSDAGQITTEDEPLAFGGRPQGRGAGARTVCALQNGRFR
jgi:hypothetical protein